MAKIINHTNRHRANSPSEVKITGGEFRSRRIKTPGGATHPMGERERIALFNMIQDRIEGSSVLDLYCGGGTLGIEALSRRAAFALFVDNDQHAIATATTNLANLGLRDLRSSTLRADIATISHAITDQYDLVFADPPYDKYEEKMVKYLPRLVQSGGILVLSHPGEPPKLDDLDLLKSRQYAGATISIYEKSLPKQHSTF